MHLPPPLPFCPPIPTSFSSKELTDYGCTYTMVCIDRRHYGSSARQSTPVFSQSLQRHLRFQSLHMSRSLAHSYNPHIGTGIYSPHPSLVP